MCPVRTEDRPEQSAQALALREKQDAAREALYDAWNAAVARNTYQDYNAAAKDPEVLKAQAAYPPAP